MIRLAILGQGMVASHFVIGIERLKSGEIEPFGVPLAKYNLPYKPEDIEVVVSYDVDANKVGKTVYEVAKELVGKDLPIPFTLKDIEVREGIHLGSLKGLPFRTRGLDDRMLVYEAIMRIVDEWKSFDIDVVVNVITTEPAKAFNELSMLEHAIHCSRKGLSATQAYAYALALYSKQYRKAAFINAIPVPIANDMTFIDLYNRVGAIVFGDDGATGATPLTADLLEHMAERNRIIKYIVQFNIGGNTDFLALDIPERNIMKEVTKSSIVEDILGYDIPHYIKPTGYLEPIGDKKYVAMHLEYMTFNNLKDEIYISARINDSPALAGLLVDLVRLGKIALDRGFSGTVYEVNAFYMKNPGPYNAKSLSKIVAYYKLLKWLGLNKGIEY